MEVKYNTYMIPKTTNQHKFIWKISNKSTKICSFEIFKDFEKGDLRIYQDTTKIIFIREG